ncbi:MAG: DUF445 family protein [Verrucomicrobiota bacterium]|nr:DUF445 family protein [Verrucomicrobiota bacterium]
MEWINFIIFPLVGCIIGALTNEIAIKMLFRPYKKWTLFGIKIPFTPGVIPSQRKIIGKNIAETFEANLLSGEEIHAIITGEKTKRLLEDKIEEFSKESLGAMAGLFTPLKPKIADKILEAIEEIADKAIAHGGELHIAKKIEAKIDNMHIAELEELILGFSRKQFRHITFFGGIIGILIGLAQAVIDGLL